MTNRIMVYAVAALAAGSLLTAMPAAASAQGQGHGKSQAKTQVKSQAKKHGKSQVKNRAKNGNGPAFCRSGAGHPTHGRSWCVEKGFGLGNARWDNADWGSVVFGGRKSSRTGTVGSRSLPDILGSVIFGRLQNQYGTTTPLTGRWVSASGGPLMLQVQSGSRPVAEFVDRNRDGRADVVLLNLSR